MIPEGPLDANMTHEGPVSLEPDIDNAHVFLSELFNPIRDLAKNFDVDLSHILTKYSEEILQAGHNGRIRNDEWQQVNFTEAALVIQGSASVYGKKVEFLYNLATKLLQFLHDEKKKASGNEKRKDKDVLVAGRHNNDEFTANDEIKYQPDANKLNEDFATAHRRYLQTFLSRTPLALITLSEAEKGDTTLMTKTGEVFGNRNDYNMNICKRDEYDFLSLPTLNCAGLNDISSEDLSQTSLSSSRLGNISCPGDFGDSTESMHVDFQPIETTPPAEIDGDIPAEGSSDKNSAETVSENAAAPEESTPEDAGADGPVLSDDDGVPHEDPICDAEPIDLPPEKPLSPVPEVVDEDLSNGSRRRSLRQANKKQAQEKAAAAKAEEIKKQWCREENKEKDFVLPIQKNAKKTRKPRKKRSSGRDSRCSTEVINEVLNSGKKGLDLQKVTLDSKALKKMAPTKDISVNEAFELLFTNNYQDEKDIADQLRRQLEMNCKASPDDGFAELDEPAHDPDDDNDDGCLDSGGGDINDIPSASADDCISPDSGYMFAYPLDRLLAPSQQDLSFEGILRAHVENYMKEADKYTENTELSERVKVWEEKIKPVLETEAQRESFDIHLYGSRIIDNFEDNNRKQSVPFAKVVEGKTSWEICRYFLATLVLANNNNVEISSASTPSGMHDVNLTLLSRKRHQEQLDAFGHGSGEHD